MTLQFAMLFPGQGSQSLTMLREMADVQPTVTEVFNRASTVLGYDVWQLVQEGPEEKLNQTEYTQPALLASDIAVWECWKANGGASPAIVAGHSLGEYAALVCAEVLHFEEAVALVAKRGRYMQEAVQLGEGAMAAIIGLDDDIIMALCEQAAQDQVVSPANFNSVGQTVVAGHAQAVNRLVIMAKENDAKLAKVLPVSVPSHCALMQEAADRLADDLSSIVLSKPQIALIHNADVQIHDDPERIRDVLVKQLVRPVRWVETIQLMTKKGVNDFVECGPGKVLSGLNKRIDRGFNTYATLKPELLKHAVSSFSENTFDIGEVR